MTRRHIAKEPEWFRCGQGEETVNHLLFQCPLARLVWSLSDIPTPQDGIMENSLYSNIYHVLNIKKLYPKDEVEAEVVPWILWRLWKNRNELMFKGKEFEASGILGKAREDAEEWQRRKQVNLSEGEKRRSNSHTSTSQTRSWRPPPAGWMKCNVDGAWHKVRHRSGAGWICRDENGRLVWAGAKVEIGLTSSINAEAKAFQWTAESMARFRPCLQSRK